MICSTSFLRLFLIIFGVKKATITLQQISERGFFCTDLFAPTWYKVLDYCYHWLTIDFSVTVHYGSNSHGGINYIQHLLRACSDLEDDEKLYGITYDNERFSITINNTFVNLEKTNMLRTTDTLFFCTKGGWQVDDENGAINSITSLFYHKLLTDHRQIIAPKKDKNIGNIRSECVDQNLVGDSCIALIEGRVGLIPYFKVGLFRMSNLGQYEASDLVENYFPKQDYRFLPIDHLALGDKRSCSSKSIKYVESESDRYFNFSECITLATPDFYYQLCCCDESLEICGSLKDDLWIDPSKPIFSVRNLLDEPDKLSEYGLDENSVRRNYQNKLDERYKKKPQIVCATGTLKVNETLREKRLIDKAFPIDVRSCRSTYRYRKPFGEEYQMTLEMNTALGCTMARKFKDGYYYCQLRGLICPTHKGFSKDEMTVDCCCEGSHLCNHDMNSYHAFHLLPMHMKDPLCAQLSSFRLIFILRRTKYCAVHYDFVLGKVVNLQINANMDLTREEDYKAYEKLGCQFIEAKIRVNIPIRCKDEIYKRKDTLMGRLIYMCTCPGKVLSERMNESACDVELEKEIAQKAITDAERSKLPSCYNINLVTNAINSAPAEISKFLMNNITKPSSESFWCYDQLTIGKSKGKFISRWISGEVKVTEHPDIQEICIKISTEDGAYTCTSIQSRVFCCCKSYGNIPCNRKKNIQSTFIHELVPSNLKWKITEQTFRQEQNFCINPDKKLIKCKIPMGCYHIRYAIAIDQSTIYNNLPAGCISDIDQTLLEKYPYLTLCSNYLRNGFAKRCFYTDTRDPVTAIPLIVCCCNMNLYNDCPLRARVINLGSTYRMIKKEKKSKNELAEKKKKVRTKRK